MTTRILLVEDDPSVVKPAVAILRDEPYRLLWATNAHDALTLARLHSPDVILLSWTLPEMNGDEFTELLSLHPATAGIPLVLMSLEPWVFGEACRQKAVQVVNKTYLYDELAMRVRDALELEPARTTKPQELERIRDRSQWWTGEEEGDWRPAQRSRLSTSGLPPP